MILRVAAAAALLGRELTVPEVAEHLATAPIARTNMRGIDRMA